jgi:hypothetical protein
MKCYHVCSLQMYPDFEVINQNVVLLLIWAQYGAHLFTCVRLQSNNMQERFWIKAPDRRRLHALPLSGVKFLVDRILNYFADYGFFVYPHNFNFDAHISETTEKYFCSLLLISQSNLRLFLKTWINSPITLKIHRVEFVTSKMIFFFLYSCIE